MFGAEISMKKTPQSAGRSAFPIAHHHKNKTTVAVSPISSGARPELGTCTCRKEGPCRHPNLQALCDQIQDAFDNTAKKENYEINLIPTILIHVFDHVFEYLKARRRSMKC